MKRRMDVDTKVKIDYAENYAMIANTWKNFMGQSKMLVKNKVEDKKNLIETNFRSWYSRSPQLQKKYGLVLENIKNGYNKMNTMAYSPSFYYVNLAGLGLDAVQFSPTV